jgi:hypothetical protein
MGGKIDRPEDKGRERRIDRKQKKDGEARR